MNKTVWTCTVISLVSGIMVDYVRQTPRNMVELTGFLLDLDFEGQGARHFLDTYPQAIEMLYDLLPWTRDVEQEMKNRLLADPDAGNRSGDQYAYDLVQPWIEQYGETLIITKEN